MSALGDRLRAVRDKLPSLPLRELTDELSAIAAFVDQIMADEASPVRPGPEGAGDG